MIAIRVKNTRKPKPIRLINDAIPFPHVMVIDENDERLGKMNRTDAIILAKEKKGMDLVLLSVSKSKTGKPIPITRILDYGKYKYDRKKKAKVSKEKQTNIQNKEVRLTPNIGIHDLNTKAKKAKEFILNGDRLKISLKFRGREIVRQENGVETLDRFIALLDDIAIVTKPAKLNGKFMDVFLQQDKKKVASYLKLQKEKEKDNA